LSGEISQQPSQKGGGNSTDRTSGHKAHQHLVQAGQI
jgi:hypothetical protein